MTTVALPKWALEETFEDVKGLIYSLVHKFFVMNGGIYQEWLSHAHEGFVEACYSFDSAKAEFNTWVGFKVWHKLLAAKREYVKVKRHDAKVAAELLARMKLQTSDFDCDNLRQRLSREARFVLSVVLELPPVVRREVEEKGGQNRNIRSTVKTWLLDCGWSVHKVNKVWKEIRLALT